jgi:uncharacterized protein (TIGR03000 family)
MRMQQVFRLAPALLIAGCLLATSPERAYGQGTGLGGGSGGLGGSSGGMGGPLNALSIAPASGIGYGGFNSYYTNYGGYGNGFYSAGYPGRGYSFGWGIAPYGRSDYYRGYFFPPQQPLGPDNRARIRLQVPAPDAEVWVDDEKMTQTGEVRDYYSPPLEPGKGYHYQFRVRWKEGGKPVEKERTIHVQANSRQEVDFQAKGTPPKSER